MDVWWGYVCCTLHVHIESDSSIALSMCHTRLKGLILSASLTENFLFCLGYHVRIPFFLQSTTRCRTYQRWCNLESIVGKLTSRRSSWTIYINGSNKALPSALLYLCGLDPDQQGQLMKLENRRGHKLPSPCSNNSQPSGWYTVQAITLKRAVTTTKKPGWHNIHYYIEPSKGQYLCGLLKSTEKKKMHNSCVFLTIVADNFGHYSKTTSILHRRNIVTHPPTSFSRWFITSQHFENGNQLRICASFLFPRLFVDPGSMQPSLAPRNFLFS
jgi:hypothetical protein